MTQLQRYRVRVGETEVDVELTRTQGDEVHARVGMHTFVVSAAPDHSWNVATAEGTQQRVWLDRNGTRPTFAATGGYATGLNVQTAAEAALEAALSEAGASGAQAGSVTAPMPGRVVKVLVSEDEAVHAGQAVVIVEAMKMENEVTAAGDGRVRRIAVAAGDTVDAGAVLIEVAPHDT